VGGHEGGPLPETVRFKIDDGLGGGGVEAAAGPGQQSGVRHLLGQGVPEAVGGLVRDRLLLEELGRAQGGQGPEQVVLGERRHPAEDGGGEAPPDDRRRLEDLLPLLPEPVDAGGQHRLDGGGHADLVEGAGQPVGPGLSGQGAVLDQGADDLLDEERVAAGVSDEVPGQRGE
jgi:hypothetical protein